MLVSNYDDLQSCIDKTYIIVFMFTLGVHACILHILIGRQPASTAEIFYSIILNWPSFVPEWHSQLPKSWQQVKLMNITSSPCTQTDRWKAIT